MASPFSLSGRKLEILTSIVKSYILTGAPVGSRRISERRKDRLSSASVRNVMAELEAQGLLTHPHTSAGRVPTEKAFRFYVQNLNAARLEPAEADFVRVNLREAGSLEERLGRSSQVLAALTHQVGIVVAAPISQAVLDYVQFVRLADRRILAVVVARGDVVRRRILRITEEIAPGELERIANYLNRNFVGWKLAAARHEILRRIEQERAAYDTVLRRLRLLYREGFLREEAETRIYMQGTPNLVEGDQALDRQRVHRLLEALEQKEKLIELLDQCIRADLVVLAQKSDGPEPLSVRVGLEHSSPVLKDFALIGTLCKIRPGLEGRLAVIGPTRMHYERVMSAVAHVAGTFHSLSKNN